MRPCRSIPSFEKQTSITPHKSSVTLAVKFGQTSYKRPIILCTTTICIIRVYCRKRVQDRIRIDDETRTNGVQDLIGAYIYIYIRHKDIYRCMCVCVHALYTYRVKGPKHHSVSFCVRRLNPKLMTSIYTYMGAE